MCLICDRIELIKQNQNPYFVKELSSGYVVLGNGDCHLHWHLFPRVHGDLGEFGCNGKGPVWWYPREKMYDDSTRLNPEELDEMKTALLAELDKLCE